MGRFLLHSLDGCVPFLFATPPVDACMGFCHRFSRLRNKLVGRPEQVSKPREVEERRLEFILRHPAQRKREIRLDGSQRAKAVGEGPLHAPSVNDRTAPACGEPGQHVVGTCPPPAITVVSRAGPKRRDPLRCRHKMSRPWNGSRKPLAGGLVSAAAACKNGARYPSTTIGR